MQLIDSTGEKAASYSYDPYGKVMSAWGAMAETNPLRYRGYYYDADTELFYLQSRYYDANVCRFINADAFASTGKGFPGYNMFSYCNNIPISSKDPTGYDAIILCDSGLLGHVGAMVQDEDGVWWHFYWGTAGGFEGSSARIGCILGFDVTPYTWCIEYGGNVTDLRDINAAKQYGYEYDDMYRMAGDFSICVDSMKYIDEKYNLYSNNCSQVTLSILSQAETPYKSTLKNASTYMHPYSVNKYLKENLRRSSQGRATPRTISCLN